MKHTDIGMHLGMNASIDIKIEFTFKAMLDFFMKVTIEGTAHIFKGRDP